MTQETIVDKQRAGRQIRVDNQQLMPMIGLSVMATLLSKANSRARENGIWKERSKKSYFLYYILCIST
jgi:hypothetical protein